MCFSCASADISILPNTSAELRCQGLHLCVDVPQRLCLYLRRMCATAVLLEQSHSDVNGSKIEPTALLVLQTLCAACCSSISGLHTKSGKGVISCLLGSSRGAYKTSGDLPASHQKNGCVCFLILSLLLNNRGCRHSWLATMFSCCRVNPPVPFCRSPTKRAPHGTAAELSRAGHACGEGSGRAHSARGAVLALPAVTLG